MKSKLLAIALADAVAAAPVFAGDVAQQQARQVVKRKDDSTLYIFKDGKMARENKFGFPWLVKADEVLETADGCKLTSVGNEAARLDGLLKDGRQN